MAAEEPTAPGPVKPWMLGLSAGLVVGSLFIGVLLMTYAPSFAQLFDGFGGDLPRLTRLVLAYANLAIVPAIVGAAAFARLWIRRETGEPIGINTLAWTGTAFGVSVAMAITWFIAMYLPIFRMGAVVD